MSYSPEALLARLSRKIDRTDPAQHEAVALLDELGAVAREMGALRERELALAREMTALNRQAAAIAERSARLVAGNRMATGRRQ